MIEALYIYSKKEGLGTVTTFEFKGIIEHFKSLIWHEKFYDKGEFELVVQYSPELLEILKPNYYVFKENYASSTGIVAMFIKSIEIRDDDQEGTIITAKGTSSSELLERRIIYTTTIFKEEKIPNIIKHLVLTNMGAKTNVGGTFVGKKYEVEEVDLVENTDGTIGGVQAERSMNMYMLKKDLPEVEDTLSMQVSYKNVLETVKELCVKYHLGFRIITIPIQVIKQNWKYVDLGTSEEMLKNINNNNFLQIIKPVDRSNYIIFSDEYDNIYNSSYIKDLNKQTNFVLVKGEGEGVSRIERAYYKNSTEKIKITVNKDKFSGETLYEAFVDARNSSSEDMTSDEYSESLKLLALEQLSDIQEAFETELFTEGVFKFGRDFFLGDYVTISKYGQTFKAQVVENIESVDENGYKNTPIFAY